MIVDDIHKLMLYQRLNLGYDCHVCKLKFFNRFEHLRHISTCKERLKCPKCGKTFGHHKIFQLHMKFHDVRISSDAPTASECVQIVDLSGEDTYSENTATEMKIEESDNMCDSPSASGEEVIPVDSHPLLLPRNRSKSKTANKKVGLTKIKMEDCLRCDECSCIYIDDKDYYKHMRNFHQLDINNMPILKPRNKKKCQSCCKQCRGAKCGSVKKRRSTLPDSNLIFRINMRQNIKNRWSKMVSQQLGECVEPACSQDKVQIKPDPETAEVKLEPEDEIDLSHLLSQVEVKIKTEPADDFNI